MKPKWTQLTTRMQWEDMAKIAELCGYVPHAGQLELHRDRTRFRIPVIGRRFGKTVFSAFEAVAVAVLGGRVMCVAPTYDLSGAVFDEATDMLLRGELKSLVVNHKTAKGSQHIVLSSGGEIVGKSSDNPKSLVSRGWDLIVFDEAAKEENPDVWHRHLAPTLITQKGGAIFPTTPEGENWLYDLFQKGENLQSGYRSWQLPSFANPELSEIEIADLMDGTTSTFYDQEILAQFVANGSTVFRGVKAASTGEWQERPVRGHRYCLGVDLGMVDDFTVIAVYDLTLNAIVHAVHFNQLDWPLQEGLICDTSKKWGASLVIDATNNESVAHHVADLVNWAMVDPFKFTRISKQEVINQLALVVERKEVVLPSISEISDPKHPARVAYQELTAFRFHRTPSGLITTGAPSGKHDDCVIAYALSVECARRYGSGSVPFIGTSELVMPKEMPKNPSRPKVPQMARRRISSRRW